MSSLPLFRVSNQPPFQDRATDPFPDTDLRGIWSALMVRLLAIPEYVALFEKAYPDTHLKKMSFAHAATAIAAFEAAAYTYADSPWDRYVDGDSSALSTPQKRGAILFFGEAKCVACHDKFRR